MRGGGAQGAAAHAAVSAMATRVQTRILLRLLDRGGLRLLPVASSTHWAPHVVGTACSPNLPGMSVCVPLSLCIQLRCRSFLRFVVGASLLSTLVALDLSIEHLSSLDLSIEHLGDPLLQ